MPPDQALLDVQVHTQRLQRSTIYNVSQIVKAYDLSCSRWSMRGRLHVLTLLFARTLRVNRGRNELRSALWGGPCRNAMLLGPRMRLALGCRTMRKLLGLLSLSTCVYR